MNATAWHAIIHHQDGARKWTTDEFNHIEDGHSELDTPVPNCDHQSKAWKGHEWRKVHVTLAPKEIFYNSETKKGSPTKVSLTVPSVVTN